MVYPGITHNSIGPIAHDVSKKKKKKKKKKDVCKCYMLHCSVEMSLEMFLNFGQLCGFEIYGGTNGQ